MREILFRGKRLDNGEWMQGYYAFHTNGLKDENYKEYHIIQPLQANGRFDVLRDVDPATVGEFTGLTDKNGTKIFEGDILAIKFDLAYVTRVYWDGPPEAIAKVFWDYDGFRLKATNGKDKRYGDFVDVCLKHTEIIGNIHDNPELIGGADNDK